jgi:hypothetical protein
VTAAVPQSRYRVGLISAMLYTGVSLIAGGAFLLVTAFTGDYTWVARLGGAFWVFLLSMIILMPTVTPWIKRRLPH